ncbi:MAG TPA: transglycosylase domain-containing protein [Mycobacteriales bacterium]|nr:transglycosylase domain-containing protein [Mycobacteriales bacterium]
MRRPGLRQHVTLLGAASLVAGVIMAIALLPIVGGAGLAARSVTNAFDKLPATLTQKPLPQVSKVVAANGKTIATFFSQDRLNVPLSKIPVSMQRAIIDIEDVRFYEHGGLDFKGSLRALLRNGASGTVTQGGSTLTQQYVKNVLVENARTKAERLSAVEDTLARKVREARYAIELEHKLSKNEILTRYLNIVYFGDGAYGVGAAARHFFNESVTKLTLPQSALLAGLVQSPEAYNPRFYPELATQRRNTVLDQMLKYHSITKPEYDQAIATPLELHLHQQPNDCVSSRYPYFCDYVKHVFENTPNLGLSLLRRGGLTVTTTLSPKVQRAADRGIHQYVHRHEPNKVAAAEAVVQPGTGKVKAIAVSTEYGDNAKLGQNSIDYAVDQEWGGSTYGFHAGSTFKLFVLAAALKQGIPLGTTIHAPASITVDGYTTCSGLDAGKYTLHNAGDSESGTFNLETGTWFSVNTFFAQLEQRTGLCTPVRLAESMGMQPSNGGHIPQVPSFVLGSAAGFTPLDLAGAYATMAAHGKYCSPIAITSIVDREGHEYPVPQSDCSQVVPAGLANTVTSILQGVLTVPGATGTIDRLTGRPAAAKTGTVDNYDGSWFAGYTPQLAAAVWAGIPSSPNKSLGGLTIGGRYYGAVFGATLAGRIWQSTMNAALSGVPAEPLSGADRSYSVGVQHAVPNVAGLSVSTAESVLRQSGFSPSVSRTPVQSNVSAGLVARTSPGAGASAPVGSGITIYVSGGSHAPSGPKPQPTTTVPHSPPPDNTPTPTPSSSEPGPTDTPSAEPTETPTDGSLLSKPQRR